jgi:hypothetical protein
MGMKDVEDLDPLLASCQKSAKVIDKDKCSGGDEYIQQ